MTNYERFNFESFDKARDKLKKQKHEVFSPADHDRFLLGKEVSWYPTEADSEGPWIKWNIPGAPSLRTMLGADLNWIAQNAEAIAMLPGWETSNGALAEWHLAKALKLKFIYL